MAAIKRANYCTNCGNAVRGRFCTQCGARVREHEAPPASEKPQRAGLVRQVLGPYRLLGSSRDIALFLGGQTVSIIGNWLYVAALAIFAYRLTHSANVVALLTFTRLLPYALFLPISGMLVDRWDRKTLMIVADLGRGACMLGLAFIHSAAGIPFAFPLVFISASFGSLFLPALRSFLPSVVDKDDLVQANALMGQAESLSSILGPALGGVLVLAGNVQLAFLINAATYLVSAPTLFLIRMPPSAQEARLEEEGWMARTLAGFHFLYRENEHVLMALALTTAGVALIGGGLWPLIAVLPVNAFHMGTQGTGYLGAALGVGALLGGLLSGPLLPRLGNQRGFVVSTAATYASFLLFGLSPGGPLPLLLLGVFSLTDEVAFIAENTLLQTTAPNEILGRVMSAQQSTLVLSSLLGSVIVGPLIAGVGPRASAVIFALAGAALFAATLPVLLRLEDVLGVRIFLRQVPALASLSRRVFDDLAGRMRLDRFEAGTKIVREGETGDRLYILKSGEVEIMARTGEREIAVARRGKGSYFGEIALLYDVPRTASVRCLEPVEAYSLSRADFESLLRRSEELQEEMTRTSQARLLETDTALQPYLRPLS